MRNYKIKTCLKCGREFKPNGSRQKYCFECGIVTYKEHTKQWHKSHLEERKEYNKQWYQAHTEYMKQWRKDHREQKKEYNKQWHKDHFKQKKEYMKQYHKIHKEELVEYKKEYMQTTNGKERHRKHQAKRKGLGYKPVNDYFVGSEGHHYDNERVIHIPEELHKSVKHCLETGQGMKEINKLAIDYLWIEMWDEIGETEPKLLEGG